MYHLDFVGLEVFWKAPFIHDCVVWDSVISDEGEGEAEDLWWAARGVNALGVRSHSGGEEKVCFEARFGLFWKRMYVAL